ncbi:MAG TPA: hypothetical protein VF847_02395 [Candidatus Deferrimicrobiaceae bacterium]
MPIAVTAARTGMPVGGPWLRSRRWDLKYITLSVVLVAFPYLAYLGLLRLPGFLMPLAGVLGTDPDGISRNLVNAVVALLVGGPHMYATFSRTFFDRGFAARHPRMLWSSILIPVVVVTLALYDVALLLTVFFFWASTHVLHQIVYITDLYSQRRDPGLPVSARLADYGVILTALYPLAAWKISEGNFRIGPNDLSAVVAKVVPLGPWMVWVASFAFGIALVAWVTSTVSAWRAGTLHGPKTLFIGLTVLASFVVPALGNLDTAFQGMNVWHSLQYLALTWVLNRLRDERGELSGSPFVRRFSTAGSGARYYLLFLGFTLFNVVVIGALFALFRFGAGISFDLAFDRAYYIAVLSVLWIHYYHDHYLFTRADVIRG